MTMIYDLIIIGGGPAGTAASVYAARKHLKTLLIAEEIGGQSKVSEDIKNWIGTPSISGYDLAENFKKHMEASAEDTLEIKTGARAVNLKKNQGDTFTVATKKGEFTAKSILVATGSIRRKLSVPGAEEFENKGITYCASCDGPIFKGKDVIVVGGGNAGFETAAQLLAYTKSVTLLDSGAEFKADPVTVKKVLSHPAMRGVHNVEILEIKGGKTVQSVVYKNKTTGELVELPTGGVFVEIGQMPATDFVPDDLVKKNSYKQIIIDPRTQKTSCPGIWAAGDNTDVLYHQNNIAAGDAVRAIEDLYATMKAR